jgi:hypothetical protein
MNIKMPQINTNNSLIRAITLLRTKKASKVLDITLLIAFPAQIKGMDKIGDPNDLELTLNFTNKTAASIS